MSIVSFRRRRGRQVGGILGSLLAVMLICSPSLADPCGMVGPVLPRDQVPSVERIGVQKTYVFFRDGMEAIALRPQFEGRIDEFGMLIPFPAVPSMRKIPDETFEHLAAAIDPPVVIYHRPRGRSGVVTRASRRDLDDGERTGRRPTKPKPNVVRVLKKEAIGMYEAVVLEAGSAQALARWMKLHGYRYPEGMDEVAAEYVDARWVFVAVKARVGIRKDLDPRPGMTDVETSLPEGESFKGFVQGLGFRFPVAAPVVPMRLSVFNGGQEDGKDPRNLVYFISDRPMKINELDAGFVKRQVTGATVWKHVTEPLPFKLIGTSIDAMGPAFQQALAAKRDPEPHTWAAKKLLSADLAAAAQSRLSLDHEEEETELLNISHRLGLKGPHAAREIEAAMKKRRSATQAGAAQLIDGMVLTVLDGRFPARVLAKQNLTFGAFEMDAKTNDARSYHARRSITSKTRRRIVERSDPSGFSLD